MHASTFVVIFALFVVGGFCYTVSVTPSDDAYIQAPDADDQGRSDGDMIFAVGANGNLYRTFIQFDTSTFSFLSTANAGGTLNSATLTIYPYRRSAGGTSQPTDFEVRVVTTAWTARTSNSGTSAETGDITWLYNVYPTSTWTTYGGDFGQSIGSGLIPLNQIANPYAEVIDLDISAVQAWIDDSSTNHGIVIKAIDESIQGTGVRLFDSTTTSYTPLLTLTYTNAANSGACCLGSVCVETTSASCSGTYAGDGTSCTASACSSACCQNDGSCTDVASSSCTGGECY